MVTGRIRQGKSKLVNSLIGERVAKEGAGPRSVTHHIESFTQDIQGAQVTLVDTPGFSDLNKSDDNIASEIRQEIGDEPIDLILFCVRMDGALERDDYRIMRILTWVFGQSIWEHVVFVLTFANNVKADLGMFTQTQADWEGMLREYAHTKGGVQADIAEQIPVVVAGDEEESLPGCDSWFAQFWATAFIRTKHTAKPAYLTVTLGLNTINNSESLESSLNETVLGRRQIPPAKLLEGVNQAFEKISQKGLRKRAQNYQVDTGATPHHHTPAPDTEQHHHTPPSNAGATGKQTKEDNQQWWQMLWKALKAIIKILKFSHL